MNPLLRRSEYAVRGAILDRARVLEEEMKAGAPMKFDKIVRCNIGNPQALGQKPLTWVRQVMSLIINPDLMEMPAVVDAMPADVVARAQRYLGGVPSAGAYSESQGITAVREDVAAFIGARDGTPADPKDIFLTDGASSGVKMVLQALLRGPEDGILVPFPQYPLYSATTTLLNGHMEPYYLDESASWGVHLAELEKAIASARAAGKELRGLVVINPGNPTGQTLPAAAVRELLLLAAREELLIMADEVYQENVMTTSPAPFTSFKKALRELGAAGASADEQAAAASVQLVSFHSTSKGFIGECGLRGGYFELTNIPDDVKGQLIKLASMSLCSNVPGQFVTGCMVAPPAKGEPSHERYAAERSTQLASLQRRAELVHKAMNALPGVTCNPAEGAMYLFPCVELPAGAIAAAEKGGMAPDAYYALRLLEGTGLVVVPGSGFGQREGTWHFRTTFLPPEDEIEGVLGRLAEFHDGFLAEHA